MERVLARGPELDSAGIGASGRLPHLDALKTALTVAVIIAHAAMTYGAVGTWIYEEDALSDVLGAALGALIVGGALFALGLFFLIAGMLTTRSLLRVGPARFLRSRVVRLGIPVVVYALVVWPALHWVIDIVVEDGPRSPIASYRDQFAGSAWQQLGTGPMWFVAILLIATAGWCLWRMARPDRRSRAAPTVIWRAVATMSLATFVIRLQFPIDSAQFLDLHVWLWPQAFVLFVVGALGAEQGWLFVIPLGMRRRLRLSLVIAVAALGAFVVFSDGVDRFAGGWHWQAAGFAAVEGVWSIGVSLLVLDWARRHVPRMSFVMSQIARASYGAFVAQGPVLVAIALALRSAGLPGDVDFVLLATLGVAVSFLVGLGLPTSVNRRVKPRTLRRRR